MINAGAILVCALLKTLVKPEMSLAEKFKYTQKWFIVCIKRMFCYLISKNILKFVFI